MLYDVGMRRKKMTKCSVVAFPLPEIICWCLFFMQWRFSFGDGNSKSDEKRNSIIQCWLPTINDNHLFLNNSFSIFFFTMVSALESRFFVFINFRVWFLPDFRNVEGRKRCSTAVMVYLSTCQKFKKKKCLSTKISSFKWLPTCLVILP